MESIHITEERDFVPVAVLESLQNCANTHGEIELDHSMARNHFIAIGKKLWLSYKQFFKDSCSSSLDSNY